MHNRRVVYSYLQDKDATNELFGPIAEAVGDRPGGYLRIIKTGFRKGDAAEMAMIELVDFNKDYQAGKASGTKRTRRGRKKAAAEVVAAPVVKEEE